MTTEEIKQSISMRAVLEKYGIKIKRNMCSCPFHGEDKHPSMKVFKDGVKCFGCGFHGDIFTFTQEIENCDFKTAFILLGGTYTHNKKEADLIKYRADKARLKREREQLEKAERNKAITSAIHSANNRLEELQEGSDEWWDALADKYNGITKDLNMEGGD